MATKIYVFKDRNSYESHEVRTHFQGLSDAGVKVHMLLSVDDPKPDGAEDAVPEWEGTDFIVFGKEAVSVAKLNSKRRIIGTIVYWKQKNKLDRYNSLFDSVFRASDPFPADG